MASSTSPLASSLPPSPASSYPTCGTRATSAGLPSASPLASYSSSPLPHTAVGSTAARSCPHARSTGIRAASVVPIGFLATVAIDLLIDGALVGLGAQLGSSQGIILTIALTLEILFLTLSLAAELTDRGLTPRQAALTCTCLGVCTAIGAVAAAAVLGDVGPEVLAFVLAFGAAALLYLAVEELLVEAHEQSETALLSAMFFAGFLAIYVLAELGG